MRIMEGARLRVKDVDFARREILIRDGKGFKDRVTMLPQSVDGPLRAHLATVRRLHVLDREDGWGEVWLPYAVARKYPAAGREWAWQYVFPADRRSFDPRSGVQRRHHLSYQAFQRAMRQAVRDAGSRSSQLHTRCGTPSRRTFSSPSTTSALCRNCSGTRTSRPR